MFTLIKTEIFKLRRQKMIIVLVMVVIAISAFSAYSEINLLIEPGNPVTGRDSFANAFQDIFML